MSSLRIKVQLGDELPNNYSSTNISTTKFVYVIESPSLITIQALIQTLEKYINEQSDDTIEIVQLTTHDGFVLSKSNLCSAVLKDNDHIICIDMNTFTKQNCPFIDFDNLWLELKQHDPSDDEEKSIQIGLYNFTKLFIRMYGTRNINSLYIFTTHELITISNEKRKDHLIARLDNKHDFNSTSSSTTMEWFLEAKWEYDHVSNKSLSIICNLKIGPDDQVLGEKLCILLDDSRMRIQNGGITHLSSIGSDSKGRTDQERERLKVLASKLPPPKQTGPHIVLNEIQNLKLVKHDCEGESLIRMACGNTNTITAYQETFTSDRGFRQHFIITHIIFSKKPTILPEILQQKRSTVVEKPVSVSSLSVFYQTHDGAWRECQDIAIAPITVRNEEPKWLTDSVINIEPDKLFSFIIKGYLRIQGEIGNDILARQRIHKSLPQPFKLKIVIQDNMGKQCSLVVEQLNKQLDLITSESFVKNYQSSINELIAFTYADDCDTDDRIYMAMYLNTENQLVIRNSGTYSLTLSQKNLRTMEFNAKQNQTTEIPLDDIRYHSTTQEIKAYALFDPETFMLYAIRFELSTKTSKTEETKMIPIEKIKW